MSEVRQSMAFDLKFLALIAKRITIDTEPIGSLYLDTSTVCQHLFDKPLFH